MEFFFKLKLNLNLKLKFSLIPPRLLLQRYIPMPLALYYNY